MLICLLVLYPASRLDWLVVARVTAGTFALMPGNAGFPPQHLLKVITSDSLFYVAPAVLLAAAVAPVGLGLSGRWKMGPAPTQSPPLVSVTPSGPPPARAPPARPPTPPPPPPPRAPQGPPARARP